MQVRPATPADLPEIQSIYAYHVLHGTGTFEEEPPSVEEMTERFAKVTEHGWSWLVATDATGVLGYAYYTQFRDRSAYRYCVEDSVYVREDVRGQGVGKALVAQADRGRDGARHAADDRGDRRFGECRLDRRACQPGVPHGRHDARGGHEVRPLAGRGVDAAHAGPRRRGHARLTPRDGVA